VKIINFNLAGQPQSFEMYDSHEEYQKVEAEIKSVFGNPIVNIEINLTEIKPRRFFVVN